jgi:hypothetical protein
MIPMPVRKGPSGEVYGNENGRALANWIVSGQRGAPVTGTFPVTGGGDGGFCPNPKPVKPTGVTITMAYPLGALEGTCTRPLM